MQARTIQRVANTMESMSNESQGRAVEPRQITSQGPLAFQPPLNDDGDTNGLPHDGADRDVGAASTGRARAASGELSSAIQAGGLNGDDEFESFHRSFAIGNNPLEKIPANSRPGFGNVSQDADAMSQMTSVAISPVSSNIAGQSQQQLEHQQQRQQQHHELQRQQHFSSQPSQSDEEDPTLAQARRSMMARSGDRHARGKLPGPNEGRFIRPDSVPSEPQIPPPRSSKRYIRHKLRPPDILEGASRTGNKHTLKDSEHVVKCGVCSRELVVEKTAVIVRCSACSKVSPASSGNHIVLSHVAPG